MFRLWRKKEADTSPAPDGPGSTADPAELRVMDAQEIAMHVVEAMRETRYWLTRDMESVAKAWWADHHVEPIQMCYLREAVQSTPGVVYSKMNLRGPKFGPIRRALADRGMGTHQQYIYEILPAQACASLGPVLTEFSPVSIQSRTRRTRSEPAADQRTRAA